MPTISCNERDLVKLTRKKLGREDLLRLLPLCKAGFEGDEEGGQVRIELQDTNRPDLWCAEGIARQIRAHLTGTVPAYGFFGGDGTPAGAVEVDPRLEGIRPAVGAFVARGVRVDEPALIQIIQTQEKLCEGYGHRRREAAMGVYNAANIAFPVRYRAVRPDEVRFVPLGFERVMTLAEICAEHPKGIEYRGLVEGKELYPLLADAAGTVLSFPPIINSRALGEVAVGDDNLFVEVTGHDMRTVAHVLNIMAVNFADRGFEILPVTARFPYDTALGRAVTIPADLRTTLELPVEQVNRALGLSLTSRQISRLLRSYGVVNEVKGGAIAATCPPYRHDYMHPVDVIEDIAIARGYDTFEVVMPTTFTVARLTPLTLLADRVRQELVGYGFQEIFSNLLMSRDEVCDRLRLAGELVAIENFVSETYAVLRDRLLPSLLRVEGASTKAPYPHRTFEVGEVAVFDEEAPHGSRTEEHAAALIAASEVGFSDVHSYLDALMYFMAKSYALERSDLPFAIEGRAARVVVDGREVGYVAEIHPAVLNAWAIDVPVAAFEVCLNPFVGPEEGNP